MKFRRSKMLYLCILIGLIALALIDLNQQVQHTLNYSLEQEQVTPSLLAQPIENQNITTDEQDHFYSGLIPCD